MHAHRSAPSVWARAEMTVNGKSGLYSFSLELFLTQNASVKRFDWK